MANRRPVVYKVNSRMVAFLTVLFNTQTSVLIRTDNESLPVWMTCVHGRQLAKESYPTSGTSDAWTQTIGLRTEDILQLTDI